MKLLSPLYTAVTVWLPIPSWPGLAVIPALPPNRLTVPRFMSLDTNATVPVGVPLLPARGARGGQLTRCPVKTGVVGIGREGGRSGRRGRGPFGHQVVNVHG